jgi:hypothetical protein
MKDETLEAAYLAGFNASGEGYNGEYGIDCPEENAIWKKDRDKAITAIKQALAAPALQAELDATNRQVEILSDALAESRREVAAQPAPVPEGSVSKGAYNRMRDDYNDLVNRSEQDAKDAKQWRKHVKYCQLQGVDLDYQLATPTAAQPAPDRTGMTYYKNDECKALDSASHDCICWTPAAPVQEPVALKETTQKAVVLLKTIVAGLESAIAKTPAQPAPVQPAQDLHFFKQVLSVAIAGLYEHYEEDVLNTFSIDELSEVVDVSKSLQSRKVEDIYKQMWDMLNNVSEKGQP